MSNAIIEKIKGKSPNLFIFTLLALSIAIIIVDRVVPGVTRVDISVDDKTKVAIHFIYVSLALIGVVFHLMSQMRKLREQDGFDWIQYRSDYIFRAFQAGVYVIVIANLVDPATINMVLISLFVGMYIRKVEASFESMGDRFGEMLKGILGTAVQRLSPTEKRQRQEELQKKYIDLKDDYGKLKGKLDDSDCKKLESEFLKVQTLIQKGKVEAAEAKLLSMDFQIKDFQLKHKNS